MNNPSDSPSNPWYREPWLWFLISLPAAAVVGGIATVWIAATHADGLVVGDYYKAGLAINQVLARDDEARKLGLGATLQTEDGGLALSLGGRLERHPERLTLVLAHPTRAGMDHTLTLHHAGAGRYRTAMPALPAGKWHAQLSDDTSAWRLSGVLYSPFTRPAVLGANVTSTTEGD